MCKIIEKFSYETGKMEKYEIIDVMVDVKVKQDEFRSSHQYYKRMSDGELFEPFDNPDKNLEADYDTYRKKHNLLSPKQIKNIRKKYGLSIREFATLLNISYSNLSSIENGSIQAGYIDSLIRLSEDPYALRKLFLERKPNFSEKTMNNLADTLEELILTSYEEHKDIAKEVREHHLDIRNNLVRVVNVICYESRKEEGEYNWIKNSNSNKKKQALKIFPFELVQIDVAVKLEASFSVSVNSKNVHQVKLNCKVALFSDDNENPFMSVDIYGLYATNNEDPELSLDKIAGKKDFMRDLIPKINEIIGFITEQGLDERMTVPENLIANEN